MNNLLGIDPGSNQCGYSIFINEQLADYGSIIVPKRLKLPSEKLRYISKRLRKLIIAYSIESVGYENTYNSFRSLTLLTAIILEINGLCKELKVDCNKYHNQTIRAKFMAAGRNREQGKIWIKKLMCRQFSLDPETTEQDTADAIMVGLYHVYFIKVKKNAVLQKVKKPTRVNVQPAGVKQ